MKKNKNMLGGLRSRLAGFLAIALTLLVVGNQTASASVGSDLATEAATIVTEIALLAPAAASIAGAVIVIAVVIKSARRVFS